MSEHNVVQQPCQRSSPNGGRCWFPLGHDGPHDFELPSAADVLGILKDTAASVEGARSQKEESYGQVERTGRCTDGSSDTVADADADARVSKALESRRAVEADEPLLRARGDQQSSTACDSSPHGPDAERLHRQAVVEGARQEPRLVKAAQDAIAFLDSVEWNDHTSEEDAGNVQHELEEALRAAALVRAPEPLAEQIIVGTCRNGSPHYCPNCDNSFTALKPATSFAPPEGLRELLRELNEAAEAYRISSTQWRQQDIPHEQRLITIREKVRAALAHVDPPTGEP